MLDTTFKTPCLYADDTQIFASSTDANVLANNINSDLENLYDWLTVNRLQLLISAPFEN